MISRVRQSGRFSMMALVLGLGIWIALGSAAWAQYGGSGGGGQLGGFVGARRGGFGNRGFGWGNRGSGLGSGYAYASYGGSGLGYGLGYGGSGYPDSGGYRYGSGYPYSGSARGYGSANPYDATYAAPSSLPYYATASAAPGVGVTSSSAYVAPAESAANTVMPAQGRHLGIDEQPITDAIGLGGVKVTNVYPGTAAERAGLRVGDVIYACNGYLTQQRGNLAWIIAKSAPETRLNMSVKTASDGREHFITAELP